MKNLFRVLLCGLVAISLMAPAAFAAADTDKNPKKTEKSQPKGDKKAPPAKGDAKDGKKKKKGPSDLDS